MYWLTWNYLWDILSGKKVWYNVFIMLGYHVNKMGVHVGKQTHTHTVTLVWHRLSLEGVLINRQQGLPQEMETRGWRGEKSGKGHYSSLYALLNHLIFKIVSLSELVTISVNTFFHYLFLTRSPREKLASVPRHFLKKRPSKSADTLLVHPPVPRSQTPTEQQSLSPCESPIGCTACLPSRSQLPTGHKWSKLKLVPASSFQQAQNRPRELAPSDDRGG